MVFIVAIAAAVDVAAIAAAVGSVSGDGLVVFHALIHSSVIFFTLPL